MAGRITAEGRAIVITGASSKTGPESALALA